MCNLYTYKMSAEEMGAPTRHFVGTTWSEHVRTRNEPIDDVYPNRRAPVVVEQDGQRIVREDMLWGFPPFKAGAGYGTNFRSLKNKLWRERLGSEHRCVALATAFCEPDKNTPRGAVEWRWFERATKPLQHHQRA